MPDAFGITALIHGSSGLELAYAAVQLPLAAAMVRARASVQKLLLSPIVAMPLTVASGVACSLFGPASPVASLIFGTAVSAGLGYAAGRALTAQRQSASGHQRGTLVLDARDSADAQGHTAADMGAAREQPSLAGWRIPHGDETKHFKFIGTTGTGKSTAISALLGPALQRGDRIVIADPDGGYLRRYYDQERSDVILNPFDARSVKWDLFGEMRQPYDAEQLARALLPDPESGDRTWHGYARTLLTAVTRQAHAAGVRDAGELYRLISIAPTSELRTLTAGTPAQPFLEEHNSRMFDSIRSVASSAVGSLEHIASQRGVAFSVRDWVSGNTADDERGGKRGGVLFIPYRADQIAALRSTVSAWMRIAIFEAMAGPELDQRLWFVIDELDALGKIDGLKDALARVRKFGGRCILGFQSIAQVASTYGAGDAHTIVENCGNTLILRCSASEGGGTSRFASTLIGQREVLRTTHSRTRRAGEFLGSVTRSEHFSIEPAVMDSEIEQLPDLAGYLKFASEDRWRRVDLKPRHHTASIEGATPAFVPVPAAAPTAAIVAAAAARQRPARAPRERAAPLRTRAAAVSAPSIIKPTGLEP